jgi:hypothetical protein
VSDLTISENCLEAGRRRSKTLSELELEVEIDAGLKYAEAPAGSPLTLSETEPLKPMLLVTLCSVGIAARACNGTK